MEQVAGADVCEIEILPPRYGGKSYLVRCVGISLSPLAPEWGVGDAYPSDSEW